MEVFSSWFLWSHTWRGISLCSSTKETFLLYFQISCIRESSPLHCILALTIENWIVFKEDQLDSNVEFGGVGSTWKKCKGWKKTEAAACLCFSKENSKKVLWTDCMQKNEEEQFELAHRSVWKYIRLNLRVVLDEYQWFLDSDLQVKKPHYVKVI